MLLLAVFAVSIGRAQDLRLNDLGYFERQGVNVLVFSNSFNGGFNDEKNSGIAVNYAHLYYPDIVSKDEIYRVTNWLYGCHPYHNYSVAPGLLFRQPDHFENFDDWPFLWGQNEGTIAGNTQYIIFGTSFKNLQ